MRHWAYRTSSVQGKTYGEEARQRAVDVLVERVMMGLLAEGSGGDDASSNDTGSEAGRLHRVASQVHGGQ